MKFIFSLDFSHNLNKDVMNMIYGGCVSKFNQIRTEECGIFSRLAVDIQGRINVHSPATI